ncbi:hypothetical protein DQ04_18561000, partial [Trypanosoma grayi]|uniref:hypothetical protein n=1 Tax=Trypanosoma grayi TaxID=71804 RepID=UPI0004F4AB46
RCFAMLTRRPVLRRMRRASCHIGATLAAFFWRLVLWWWLVVSLLVREAGVLLCASVAVSAGRRRSDASAGYSNLSDATLVVPMRLTCCGRGASFRSGTSGR